MNTHEAGLDSPVRTSLEHERNTSRENETEAGCEGEKTRRFVNSTRQEQRNDEKTHQQ